VAKIFDSARHSRVGSFYREAMAWGDPESIRGFLEGLIAAFAILGGSMAYCSGFYANQVLAQSQPPELLSQRINEGLGLGFRYGSPLSIIALIIMMWT
jgi:hypothetical protein